MFKKNTKKFFYTCVVVDNEGVENEAAVVVKEEEDIQARRLFIGSMNEQGFRVKSIVRINDEDMLI